MKKTLISTILATALISTMIATVANASVTEDNILINLNSSVETNIEEIDYASMISSIQFTCFSWEFENLYGGKSKFNWWRN